MKQPIAGVSPAELGEVTIMTVWPSLAAFRVGRLWGRLYANQSGFHILGIPITTGRILALLSIPFILPPYFLTLLPCFIWIPKFWIVPRIYWPNSLCRRYRLTNQRLVVQQGLQGEEQRSVALDRFDSVIVEVSAGQDWYSAGDLVFRLGNVETFRLEGVARPEAFRHTCLKARQSYVGVQAACGVGAAG